MNLYKIYIPSEVLVELYIARWKMVLVDRYR